MSLSELKPTGGAQALAAWGDRLRPAAEAVVIPIGALAVSMFLFGVFVAVAAGVDPIEMYGLIYKGAFGTWFSWQNTLQRAAPLILAALCTALPAHLGMVVIGGEGALVLGGLAAVAIALPLDGIAGPWVVIPAMALAGMLAGGAWIGASGALRHYRGVNETISTLLTTYIAIAVLNHMVEGPMKDPASLNKPSTHPVGSENMLGNIPGMDVHWGLVVGLVACVLLYVLIYRTPFGLAARVTGGNAKAARAAGLPVGRLVVVVTFLAGAGAGLAGMLEVAAVHGKANASLAVGYGFTGILVAFLARHNPLAIVPVAILMGGLGASGGFLQRRLELPDATIIVFQGIIFLTILASEALYGRFRVFRPREG